MKFYLLRSFDRDFVRLPPHLRQATLAALDQLLADPRHPSLRFKKMQGQDDVWEIRVTRGYRVTLEIDGETYILRRVGPHDILKQP